VAPVSPLACACPGSGEGGVGIPGHGITHGDLTPHAAPRAPSGCSGVPLHLLEHPHEGGCWVCWHLLFPSVWSGLEGTGGTVQSLGDIWGVPLCAKTCIQIELCPPPCSARGMASIPKYPPHSPCIRGRGTSAGTWRTL